MNWFVNNNRIYIIDIQIYPSTYVDGTNFWLLRIQKINIIINIINGRSMGKITSLSHWLFYPSFPYTLDFVYTNNLKK